MQPPLPAHVFLVDADVAVRRGMRERLEGFATYRVVGEAAGPDGVRMRLRTTSAHVVVVSGRPEDGAEVCRLVRQEASDAALLVRTTQVDDGLLRATRGHVVGYVSEEAKVYDFLRALDRVLGKRAAALTWSGGLDEADQRLLERLPPTLARLLSGLTPQERRILELYAEGLTHEQIAEQLYLARATVRTYLGAIGRKLGWDDHRED